MLAHVMHIGHLDLRHLAPDNILYLHPELAGVRLGLGYRRPVIPDMLILAGYLTVVASIAFRDINYKRLHYLPSPL
jgi:hypothetical protein